MKKTVHISKAISVMILMLGIVTAHATTNVPPVLLRLEPEGPDLSQTNVRLFVGEVLEVRINGRGSGQQIQLPAEVEYRVRVQKELLDRESSEEVLIAGIVGVQGSHVEQVDMPLYQTNSVVAIAAKRSRSGHYQFAGRGMLPIGCPFPQAISRSDVPRLMEAFDELREFCQEPVSGDGRVRQVREWLRSKSDYLWSLGISVALAGGDDSLLPEVRAELNRQNLAPARKRFAERAARRFSLPQSHSPE